MRFSIEPIAHDPPYKRIDLNPPRPITRGQVKSWMEEEDDRYRDAAKKREDERIWEALKQVSET